MTAQKEISSISVYILAKNEDANIKRCIDSLAGVGWDIYVLDSGSEDLTRSLVESSEVCNLINYNYRNHCESYNEITSKLAIDYDYVIVIDADMVITKPMHDEIRRMLEYNLSPRVEAVIAPVEMWTEGVRLLHGSLYPPKPFLFKTGKMLFESIGHGERLKSDVEFILTKSLLVHDDRKDYSYFLMSQYRYSKNLYQRGISGVVNWKDRLRLKTPLLLFLVPIYSYFKKLGFLDGRAGIIYALDRLIAEAIMYRQSIAKNITNENGQ